jgi:hypothetical protein
MKREDFNTDSDFQAFRLMKDQLQNFTLLERSLNNGLDRLPFADKAGTYAESAFALTRQLSALSKWDFEEANSRAEYLADLAVKAWPR